MKNRFLLTLFLILISVSVAGATSYTVSDVKSFSGEESLIEAGEWLEWTHTYSFDPALESITSASLTFSITDSDADTYGDWASYEIAFVITEGWNIGFREVDTANYSLGLNSRGLENGSYSVYLTSLWGDFILNSSTLNIAYIGENDAPAPVPEPATLVLLGIGLVGIAGVSRKNQLKK